MEIMNLLPSLFSDGGRANFVGGGMGRRGFLKMLAGLGGGIAAAKTGLLKLAGKEPAKQVAKEVVQKSTTGSPPPYFFKLAEKIKMMGDDATATTDRTIAKTLKSKDGKSTYVLEEDVTSGDTIIKKINKEGDEMMTDVEIMELKKGEVVMGKNGKPVKVPDEYEEVTEVNARIEGDTFNDPYYSDGIQVDEIIKEIGEQAPSIKKASGGIARLGYQMGGDVAYDATDSIYGSSAATFTPDTIMDQFGNQVQAEMGNNFNKPLIPQVTEEITNRPSGNVFKDPITGGGQPFYGEARKPDLLKQPIEYNLGTAEEEYAKIQKGKNRPSRDLRYGENMSFEEFKAEYDAGKTPMQSGPYKGPQTLPVAGGIGSLPEIDMPIAGGNNNQMGILPVMPKDEKIFTKQPVEGEGSVVGNYNDPLPQDQLMAGFAEWKRNNPDKVSMIGHAAMSYMTLPNGEPITFSGGAQASNMAQYLESIGQPPMTRNNNPAISKPIGNPNAELKMALASGGIARMLGE